MTLNGGLKIEFQDGRETVEPGIATPASRRSAEDRRVMGARQSEAVAIGH